jgi:hypothetical protein
MPEATTEKRCAAHLPHQPGVALGARRQRRRQKLAELLRQVHEDCAGLEDANRLLTAVVAMAGILEFGLSASKPLPN